MKIENRWTLGTKNFVVPPLPAELRGRHGCNLQCLTFDPEIGEEVCAVYREEPAYADQFANIEPFNLMAHAGLVRTPHGVVAFIVWRVAAESPQEVLVEQYLNPQTIGAIRLVASAANQSHFKLVILDNQTSKVTAFVDFENVFEFDRLASAMALAIGHEPECDFAAATQHVMDHVSVQELVVRSQTDSVP